MRVTVAVTRMAALAHPHACPLRHSRLRLRCAGPCRLRLPDVPANAIPALYDPPLNKRLRTCNTSPARERRSLRRLPALCSPHPMPRLPRFCTVRALRLFEQKHASRISNGRGGA